MAKMSHSVRILVGFPEDGPLDIVARIVARSLPRNLDAAVLVENRVGDSGNVATAEAAGAAPDGRTLLLCGPAHVINDALFPDLDFAFSRDFTPVALIAGVPLVVEVNPSASARSVPEFMAYVRGNPGRLRVAFAGVGTPQHIAIELFQMMADVQVALVPYAGSASALDALLRGDADAMFDPAPSSMPHISAGRLVPIATTGTTRSNLLPDVPALAEHLPGYEAGSWFGLGAPRNTPAGAVDALNRTINDALTDGAARTQLKELGATLVPGSPDDFRRFLSAEADKYRRVIEMAGVKPVRR